MQESNFDSKYLSVILTEFKSSERDLYPLTKKYPLCLFPIGNKKLIVYQLEALQQVTTIEKIVIALKEKSKDSEQIYNFITKTFLIEFPNFGKKIDFSYSSAEKSVAQLQQIFKKSNASKYKGVVVSVADTIFPLTTVIDFLQFKQAKQRQTKGGVDLAVMFKQKKQFENQKKAPESEIEVEIDNALIGDGDQLLFIDTSDEYENNGVNLLTSIYRRCKKASFKRVVDAKVYVFNSNAVEIVGGVDSDSIDDLKPWLIQSLVEHQTNKSLLKLNPSVETVKGPLNIFTYMLDQESQLKRISTKKFYEGSNFDSLIRGNKQKEMLLPTKYSFASEGHHEFKGCLIMKNSSAGAETKMIRSCVENNCKIGKKCEILRCVIMGNVSIHDNCKITDSVIGHNTVIGSGSKISSSYFAPYCLIPDEAKIDNDLKIPNQ